MFFLPLLLLLSSTAINATLPDVNSFVPNILEMFPFNGQLKIGNQVYNFGDPSARTVAIDTSNTTPEALPETNSPQTPVLTEVITPSSPSPPIEAKSSQTLSLPSNTQTTNISPSEPTPPVSNPPFVSRIQNFETSDPNFGARIPNIGTGLPSFGSGISHFETSDPNFVLRIPNFETRVPTSQMETPFGIPNFESRNPNFLVSNAPQTWPRPLDSRIPDMNSFPNIGSTEIGSTFARNENSNFVDEFSDSTPIPSTMPMPSNGQFNAPLNSMNGRSNSFESPLVVMPLVVSPNRLLQTENPISTSTPVPIPMLFNSDNNPKQPSFLDTMPSMIKK